jgi:hypothetical protein
MSTGFFRPRQGVQRVTANAGNRAFIAGGRGPGRRTPAGTPPALTLRQALIAVGLLLTQRPPEPPSSEEGQRDDL